MPEQGQGPGGGRAQVSDRETGFLGAAKSRLPRVAGRHPGGGEEATKLAICHAKSHETPPISGRALGRPRRRHELQREPIWLITNKVKYDRIFHQSFNGEVCGTWLAGLTLLQIPSPPMISSMTSQIQRRQSEAAPMAASTHSKVVVPSACKYRGFDEFPKYYLNVKKTYVALFHSLLNVINAF